MKRKKKLKQELELLQSQIEIHNKNFNYDNFLNTEIGQKTKTDSWFDIQKSRYVSDCHLTLPSLYSIPKKEFMKCKKILLMPNHEQKKIMMDWLEGFRLMYNETVKMVRILWS